MQQIIQRAFQWYFGLGSRLFPRYFASKAVALLFTVRLRHPDSRSELPQADSVISLDCGGLLSQWNGSNGKTALFVHGWSGALTQFSASFNDLLQKGYTVYGITPPGHLESGARYSHPGLFIQAIQESLGKVKGPISVAVGHSMGAGTLGLVAARQRVADSLVLVSSPASFYQQINQFAAAISLSVQATTLFCDLVERQVGIAHDDLEVAKLANKITVECLVIHDEDDRQIAHDDAIKVSNALTNGRLMTTQGLGHNRILKSERVAAQITYAAELDTGLNDAANG